MAKTKRKDLNIGEHRDVLFPSAYGKHVKIYENFLDNFKNRIIALDLGMIYGFAYLKGHQLVYGYHNAKPTKYATQVTSAFTFSSHIIKMGEDMGGVDAILFEEVHGTKGQYAMQVNGMFIGSMLHAAKVLNCKVIKGYQVSAIKKYATSGGRVGKEEMIEAANTRYGLNLNPKDDIDGNIADAVHLLSLGMEAMFSMGPLDKYVKTRIGK